jgi:EmrB/QacA subfamily drug resistance transporter
MKTPCDDAVPRTATGQKLATPTTKSWILAATILGSSMAFIDSTVVNVALPAIQINFHANVVDVQWVVESYGLFLAALILVGGSLGDLYGRRRAFLSGVAIFALASMACGAASSIDQLIVARSIQGIGAALLVPGSLAIISASFEEKTRGQAIGTWSGFTAITTAIGPVLGGWLVQHASWRWAFFINLPIALGVIAISFWRIPESRNSASGTLDWTGAILATAGLGGLVNGFIESVTLGWRHPLVFGSLVIGVVSLTTFVFVEARAPFPMAPLDIFKSRSFSGANLLTLLLYAAIGTFFFVLPLNLIQVQGYSSSQTGAALLPSVLMMFSLSRWSGGLVRRYGPRLPLQFGPSIAALGFVLFTLPSIGGSYWLTFFPATMVLGFGMAVTVAPLTTVVMSSAGQERAGTASGINNAVARVAGVLAIAVLGIVMVHAFGSRLERSLALNSVPPGIAQQIKLEETKLAGMPLPAGIDSDTQAVLKKSVGEAFVFGFRVIMWICAGLSVGSAVVAWAMVSSGKP